MQENIFAIRCSKCGSPVDFDIVTQNYHCVACGCDMPAAEVTKAARERNEAFDSEQRIRLSKARNAQSVYSCKSCGASVMMQDNEFVAQCDFCGTSVAKQEFGDTKFPQGIIPFYITREETIRIFRLWAYNHRNLEFASLALLHIEEILGFYMPYQMITGPLRLTVDTDLPTKINVGYKHSDRFVCGGYLDGIFVSQSLRVNNNLLDEAEPFDVSDLRPFDFSFIAGHKALLPEMDDITRPMIAELEKIYRKEVSKQLGATQIIFESLEGDSAQKLIYNTVYLPIYVLRLRENFFVVINGQTGRISCGNEIKSYKSEHGFLKRSNSLELERDFRQFPEYKPQRPLFYKDGVAGVYTYDFSIFEALFDYQKFIPKKTNDNNWDGCFPMVILGILVFVIPYIASTLEALKPWTLVIGFLCLLAFILFTQFMDIDRKKFHKLTFRIESPKYGNGGSRGDSEVYHYENYNKRKKWLVPLMLVAFIVSLVFCIRFAINLNMGGRPALHYPSQPSNVNNLDSSAYYIAFNARRVKADYMRKNGMAYSATVQFTHIDGQEISLKYQNNALVRIPEKNILVYRRIDLGDYDSQPWNVSMQFYISIKWRTIDSYSIIRPGKGKADFILCDSSDSKAQEYLQKYIQHYGKNIFAPSKID